MSPVTPVSPVTGSERLERSDDPQPLAAVVENLASRVATLEASNTGKQDKLSVVMILLPGSLSSLLSPSATASKSATVL